MKKWRKITLISLGSLLGLLIVTVAVACWLIFTPAQLTKIVNNLASKYLTCEAHFQSVDLSLFRTFPDAGVQIHDVSLVNPMPGAPSDTVARISTLTVGINVRQFLADGSIVVQQVVADDAAATLFTATDGTANYMVFPSSSDQDTSASEPFTLPNLDLKRIEFNGLSCRYLDSTMRLDATLRGLDLSLRGTLLNNDLDGRLAVALDSLALLQLDSARAVSLAAEASALHLVLTAKGTLQQFDGQLDLKLPKARVAMGGTSYINDTLYHSTYNLLELDVPYSADLQAMRFTLAEALLGIDRLNIGLDGTVALATDNRPMNLDFRFDVDEVALHELLPLLPAQYASWSQGMRLSMDAKLNGTAVGELSDTLMPLVQCSATVSNGSFAYSALPMPLSKIGAEIDATLDLSGRQPSSATIRSLSASWQHNKVNIKGRADNLLGDILLNANVNANLALAEACTLLPDTLPLQAQGNATLALNAHAKLSQFTALDLHHIIANGTLRLDDIDVVYDTIHASSPSATIAIQLPATNQYAATGKVLQAGLKTDKLHVDMPSSNLVADLYNADITAGVSDFTRSGQPINATLNVALPKCVAHMDSISLDAEKFNFKGTVAYNDKAQGLVNQLQPRLAVSLGRTLVYMPQLVNAMRLTSFEFDYKPGECNIDEVDVNWGLSDFHLAGRVFDLEEWLEDRKMLRAKLDFTSSYTDVDQLMSMLSGMGSDPDTLEAQRQEDNVDTSAQPFIVPRDVDFKLNTHISKCVAFGNDLTDLGGSISIRDGKAILDQVGFACKAARMQLTGIYKSPRPNHLYLGVDFHLLDIRIDELIDMIPYVDTLVPMLAGFEGNANFHLALEGYLDANYSPKTSTLLGSAAISARDLVVLDGETFDKIATLLMFSKKTVNRIDSLDVEATLFRNTMEIYPFLFSMDKYQLCAAGLHSLDNNYNYHIELLKSPLPMRLAVDVKGTMPNIGISLGKVRYSELYNPTKQDAVKRRTLEIKRQVRQALEENVR